MRLLAILILALSACTVEEDPTRRYPTPNANACATVGATRCAGNWVQTCVNNIWTATTDCSSTGASCVESSSNPGTFVCEVVTTCSQPGAERCNGDVIETCIGTDWVAGQDCSLTGSTCEASGTTADCQPAGCLASQLDDTMCVGTVLLECDGSSWQLIEDCAERNPPHLCELSTVTGVAS